MEQTLPPAASPPPARGFGLRSWLCACGLPSRCFELLICSNLGSNGRIVGYAPFDGF